MGDIFVTFFLGKQKRFSVQFVCFFFFFVKLVYYQYPLSLYGSFHPLVTQKMLNVL